MGIAQYSTRSSAPSARLQLWNELASANWSGVRVSAPRDSFEGTLRHTGLRDVQFARVQSSRAEIIRSIGHDRADRVTLHYQRRGTSRNFCGGMESLLTPGDIAIFRSTDDYRIELSDGNDMLVADFGEALLRGPIGVASAACMAASRHPTGLIGGLIDGVLRIDDDLDREAGGIVEASFAEFLRLMLRPPRGDDNAGLRQRALALITRHLHDPDLRTSTIAAHLAVSERAVQYAFALHGETPMGVMLARRLDQAARDLRSSTRTTITEIALGNGFSSSSYFTRCFRDRFGTTPRHYRSLGPIL
ncbi:helix-turn-helix domain-containing protein [Altererythrobacter xixiisoli]|uniref:Helix-turn-helix domain-containing protein n=1 Tax=Croceibacterium xixiisoli TaxID=1476466 RepID=A0A6I4TU15_9SPHN|nr:AraC family transcriptional regulator [Croceibacterium xixiisoli]MXO98337.1 helix-turn-helix domain-containing protein [Croceibacterium xixiisoli]